MTELARSFPSMCSVDGAGGGWNIGGVIAWLNSGAPTSGSRWAAMFLLSVWSPTTNWRDDLGTHGIDIPADSPHCRFDVNRAMQSWDAAHRAAFVAWAKDPFWP